MKENKNNSKSTKNRVLMLTESAAMIAFATVLSIVKIVDMPYGGSVTACSMLPLLIISYRYGTKWGLLTSFTYGVIQMLLGMDNLTYATSFWAVIAIILFDYLFAFVVLGLGGLFRKLTKTQGQALCTAAIVTGLLRYLCHTVSGCTVWAGMALPTKEALIYSLSYNLTYMLPEIIVLAVGAVLVSRLLDFSQTDIKRIVVRKSTSVVAVILSAVADVALVAAVIVSIVFIAPYLQAEDGSFLLKGILLVNWTPVLITLLCGVAVFAILFVISNVIKKKAVK
ncbi:MAG: energy-coupled thiamine transporter ThiT [Ruminococcus sp.]|nr:energy-coupled thiamine transporter ThiT [Ruminococcus sp.]